MRLFRLFLLPVLLLLLAACGTTATPVAPTPVPTTVTTGNLPETAAVQDMLGGELSVNYPAGWAAKTEGESIRILLATGAELLENTNAALTAGQIQVAVSATPLELSGANASPKTFLDAFVAAASVPAEATAEAGATTTPGTSVQIGTVTETTIKGNPAARVTMTASGSEALVLVFANSEAYILLIGTTAAGELAGQEA